MTNEEKAYIETINRLAEEVEFLKTKLGIAIQGLKAFGDTEGENGIAQKTIEEIEKLGSDDEVQ
tara:strand:+ start:2169 stop:2360 length:192 start_codon:yes stop_codon:yes gene_type:complete